ncbi:MAG: IS200/IS605 family transposase [Synoicihabitans sp.]
MANTYTSLQYHVVFSTKGREPWLSEVVCARLWPYLGGIARQNGMKALEIGGVADHVHLLLAIPPSLSLSRSMQLLKGASSRWVHENFAALAGFGWQDGYGAFTVSGSRISRVRKYIRDQPEHHRVTTFAEEYEEFLQKHGVEYEKRYLLG